LALHAPERAGLAGRRPRGFLDYGRLFFWAGFVDGVASSTDLGNVASRPLSIPSLQFGIDDSVRGGYDHPAGLAAPGGCGDRRRKVGDFARSLGKRFPSWRRR
jgi:hypothetical protein